MTLTFNLLSAAETPAPEADPATELVHCLTEHFTTPAALRYGGRDLGPPNRLVFLLDHEYTQGPELAPPQGRRRGACRAGARRGGAGRVSRPTATSRAVPSSPACAPTFFSRWSSSAGRASQVSFTSASASNEVCAATPSVDLVPYQSEAMAGVLRAARLTRRPRLLRPAPCPGRRAPGRAAPAQQPPGRDPARLPQAPHLLRRAHRLGPPPNPRSTSGGLTSNVMGCLTPCAEPVAWKSALRTRSKIT